MRFFLLLFSLLVAFPLHALDVASDEVFSHPVTVQDEQFSSTYRKVAYDGPWVADFTQIKHIFGVDRSFRSSGTMCLQPGSGIVWNIKKPYPSTMVVGSSFLVQQFAGQKPSRMDFGENPIFTQISRTIEMVLAGSISTLDESFSLYFWKEGEEWVLALCPKQEQVASFVESFVLAGREQLETVLMHEKGGDSITYQFSHIERRELSDEERAVFSW